MKIIANDGENVDRFQDRIYLLDRCQSSKVHLALLHEKRVNQKQSTLKMKIIVINGENVNIFSR